MKCRILGVDPGLASLGWGLLEVDQGVSRWVAHGALTTEPGEPEWDRARVMMRSVEKLARDHGASVVGVETWNYRTKQVTTASHQLGLVIGGVIGLVTARGIRVVPTGTAQEWRTSLGLPGKCHKRVVQAYVRERLKLAKIPQPQHASDALAVALATVPKL